MIFALNSYFVDIPHEAQKCSMIQVVHRWIKSNRMNSLCDATVAFDEWIKLFDEKPWIAERIEKLEYDMKLIMQFKQLSNH